MARAMLCFLEVTMEKLGQIYEGKAKKVYATADPDLVIRTGKERRISNFLLYQAAYAEFYFSDKMFPEFSDADLDEAIAEYGRRTRRFGKTDEQCREEEKNKKV